MTVEKKKPRKGWIVALIAAFVLVAGAGTAYVLYPWDKVCVRTPDGKIFEVPEKKVVGGEQKTAELHLRLDGGEFITYFSSSQPGKRHALQAWTEGYTVYTNEAGDKVTVTNTETGEEVTAEAVTVKVDSKLKAAEPGELSYC